MNVCSEKPVYSPDRIVVARFIGLIKMPDKSGNYKFFYQNIGAGLLTCLSINQKLLIILGCQRAIDDTIFTRYGNQMFWVRNPKLPIK
jgi:hypothetical protein